MNRITAIIGLILVLTVTMVVIFPWMSPLARTTWVDTHTGRRRISLRLACIPVSHRISETAYSRSWSTNFGNYPPPEWVPVSEFKLPFGHRSPSFGFMGVFEWEANILSAFDS